MPLHPGRAPAPRRHTPGRATAQRLPRAKVATLPHRGRCAVEQTGRTGARPKETPWGAAVGSSGGPEEELGGTVGTGGVGHREEGTTARGGRERSRDDGYWEESLGELGFGAIYSYPTAMESSESIRWLELIGPRRAGPLSVPCLGRHGDPGTTLRPGRARHGHDRSRAKPCLGGPIVPGPYGQGPVWLPNFLAKQYCSVFAVIWQLVSNHSLIRFKKIRLVNFI